MNKTQEYKKIISKLIKENKYERLTKDGACYKNFSLINSIEAFSNYSIIIYPKDINHDGNEYWLKSIVKNDDNRFTKETLMIIYETSFDDDDAADLIVNAILKHKLKKVSNDKKETKDKRKYGYFFDN